MIHQVCLHLQFSFVSDLRAKKRQEVVTKSVPVTKAKYEKVVAFVTF